MLTSFDRRYVAKKKSRTAIPVPLAVASHIEAQDNSVSMPQSTVRKLLGNVASQSTYKQMHITPLVSLNPVDVMRCFDTLDEGVPYSCFQFLLAQLSVSKLKFSRHDGELTPTAEMQSYIDNVLKKLQYDALRAIMAIGVVPIAMKVDENSGRILPYVPKHGTYTIAHGTVRGESHFVFHWIHYGPVASQHIFPQPQNGRKASPNDPFVVQWNPGDRIIGSPDDSVKVLGGFNHDPGIDGKICSPVASFLRRTITVGDAFTASALVAERTNCNPPIGRQYDDRPDKSHQEKMRGSEFVGDGIVEPTGENEARRLNNVFFRNNRQVAMYEAQEREMAERIACLTGKPLKDRANCVTTISHDYRSPLAQDAHGNAMPWANDVALPEGWKHVALQLPHPRNDLVNIWTSLDSRVFLAFLLPRQSVEANSTISADAESAEKSLEVVVAKWREYLSKVLTYAHDATYTYDDMAEAFEMTIKRKQKGEQTSIEDPLRLIVSDDELQEIYKNLGTVRVSFAAKPRITKEELDALLARGAIDWETYTSLLAEIFGLDPTMMSQTDKFPEEARRMMGLPDYATYLQLVEGRTREDNRSSEADTSLKLQKEQVKIAETVAESAAEEKPPAKKKAKKK